MSGGRRIGFEEVELRQHGRLALPRRQGLLIRTTCIETAI
jgi:hypothetical protein